MDSGPLKQYLMEHGATLVGVGDITRALTTEIMHLNRGIAIAVNRSLSRETVSHLLSLQRLAEDMLREKGFRAFVIPPDSDRRKGTFISRLYKLVSHKTAATCSGLGWIGKNGLLINRRYGSKLSWASVLTNAPLNVDQPVTESQCGICNLCVQHCPSGALKGHLWSIGDPLQEIVSYEKCAALKNERLRLQDKPNCGFCITVCPYSRGLNGKHRDRY